MRLTIDLLDDSDENRLFLVAALRYGLETAHEAEVVHPDFAATLSTWMRAETVRMRPMYQVRPRVDHLRESKWFCFWSELKPEQEVRWTNTIASTYFCVTGELVTDHPDAKYRNTSGPFVELRRHTGKTFWAHVAQIRPDGWTHARD